MILIGVGVLVLVIVVAAGVLAVLRNDQTTDSWDGNFAVGDCIVADTSRTKFERVPCTSPQTSSKVYAVLAPAELEGCLDADGAEQAVTQTVPTAAVLCIGPKDINPAQSINNVRRGECISSENPPQRPRRVACLEPGARLVDQRVDDPRPQSDPAAPQDCVDAGAGDAEWMFYFGVDGIIDGKREEYYRLLCLSPAKS